MDDVQLMSGDVNDLVKFNSIMTSYEAQSGAMLSRGKKSKVMGLGKWQGWKQWPQQVSCLQTVETMKILGFMVCPQYQDTLQRTWDMVLRGFQKALFSWGGRVLKDTGGGSVKLQW